MTVNWKLNNFFSEIFYHILFKTVLFYFIWTSLLLSVVSHFIKLCERNLFRLQSILDNYLVIFSYNLPVFLIIRGSFISVTLCNKTSSFNFDAIFFLKVSFSYTHKVNVFSKLMQFSSDFCFINDKLCNI